MMELGTFGAVMEFASQVATRSAGYYEAACVRAQGQELREVLKTLRDGARKDRAAIEQIRRENVTEMILEPIAGLHRDEFEAVPGEAASATDAEILATALLLEERDRRFFQDSSAKLPLPEVARAFRRVARKKEETILMLRGLAG
jgi:hypothetical protein